MLGRFVVILTRGDNFYVFFFAFSCTKPCLKKEFSTEGVNSFFQIKPYYTKYKDSLEENLPWNVSIPVNGEDILICFPRELSCSECIYFLSYYFSMQEINVYGGSFIPWNALQWGTDTFAEGRGGGWGQQNVYVSIVNSGQLWKERIGCVFPFFSLQVAFLWEWENSLYGDQIG